MCTEKGSVYNADKTEKISLFEKKLCFLNKCTLFEKLLFFKKKVTSDNYIELHQKGSEEI